MDMKLPQSLIERWNKISNTKPDTESKPDSDWGKMKGLEKINDRSKEVMDTNPSFFPDLLYIISGIKAGDIEGNKQIDETGPKSTKARAKLKDKMLRKFSAEEIKGLCKSRYSLMTLEDFLLILNRMNSASSGNLLRDK